MTSSNDPQKPTGYRGALPERDDTLAKPWILGVVAVFVLIFVLAALEVPSRFIPEPTPAPVPSLAPSESASADASGSGEASTDASAGASAEPSASAADESDGASAEASAAP